MIAHLEGALREKSATRAIVSVGGVGYEVLISLSTFSRLPDEGKEVSLRIHTHVREDVIQLFGFHSELERALFEELIRVNGVGPKLAQAVLSGCEPRHLLAAIREGDLATLRSVPGVGPKTAQRILIDLRDRVADLPAAAGSESAAKPAEVGSSNELLDTVISALVNLGTTRARAERAAERALADASPDDEIETLIRYALRGLAK